jgi:hypothetical protein
MAQATFLSTGAGSHFWLTPGQTATWLLLRRMIGRKRSFAISQIARETHASRGRCYSRMCRLRSLGLIGFRPLRYGRNGRTIAWTPKPKLCSAKFFGDVTKRSAPKRTSSLTGRAVLSEKAERGYFRWWASVNGRIRPKSRSISSVGDVLACLVSQLATRNLG